MLTIVVLLLGACSGSNDSSSDSKANNNAYVNANDVAKDSANNNAAVNVPSSSSSGASQEHIVNIVDFKFDPEVLQVKEGDTVTWINKDRAAHTATADDGTFNSDNLDKGAQFSYVFGEDGEYSYTCIYHPSMKASVIVG